jgi:hypothetical protein
MSTLKVDTIQKRTGTGTINVGQSGDTIAMPSATLTTALPVASGGTGGTSFSAAGLSNTSAFMARLSSNQSVSSGSFTKIVFNAEDFDSDSNFDTSNGRFTPTTAGKYWCYTSLAVDELNDQNAVYSAIYFNGSHANGHSSLAMSSKNTATTVSNIGATFTFNGSSDYIEVYGLHNYGSNRNFIGNSTTECVFTAYRLIGA